MKIDCSICAFSKYINSRKVLEKHCCNFCKEKNYIYYRPDILDIKSFLGYDIEDVMWRKIADKPIEDVDKSCDTCKYHNNPQGLPTYHIPCRECFMHSMWESK